MRYLIYILTLSIILGIVSYVSAAPNYEVYVLLSASWANVGRFVSIDNDDIKEKNGDETAVSFAYIKGPDVEMIFGPGPRKETVFIFSKGSFDFADQQSLLSSIGADANNIKTVVMEAACLDHAGGTDAFPNASFVIQDKEFNKFTYAGNTVDYEKVKKLKEEGRLRIIDGDVELAPGIKAYLLGGHTYGNQCLSINTKDGMVVLVGDGLFTYENLMYDVPSPFDYLEGDLVKQKEAYKRIREITGGSDKLLVPGHDMEVFRRFPKLAGSDRIVQVKLLDIVTSVKTKGMLATTWGEIRRTK